MSLSTLAQTNYFSDLPSEVLLQIFEEVASSDPWAWASLLKLDWRIHNFLMVWQEKFVTELFPMDHRLDGFLVLKYSGFTYKSFFTLRRDRDLLATITADFDALPPGLRNRHATLVGLDSTYFGNDVQHIKALSAIGFLISHRLTRIPGTAGKVEHIKELPRAHHILFDLFRNHLMGMLFALGTLSDCSEVENLRPPAKVAADSKAKMRLLAEVGSVWNLQAIRGYFITACLPSTFTPPSEARPSIKAWVTFYTGFRDYPTADGLVNQWFTETVHNIEPETRKYARPYFGSKFFLSRQIIDEGWNMPEHPGFRRRFDPRVLAYTKLQACGLFHLASLGDNVLARRFLPYWWLRRD